VKSARHFAAVVWACALSIALSAQSPRPEISPRITRLETWLSAAAQHRPGALDDAARRVNEWNQEQLRLIWIDVTTLVSLIREPGVSLFYVSEPTRAGQPARPVSPIATARATQVLYGVGELRRLRELADGISPTRTPGPENDVLKRGAMLHADIAMLDPTGSGPGDVFRPGPGGVTLFTKDGQQVGLQGHVSHWNMGRRLLDRVRPVDSKTALKTTPDPGGDDTVRRWYLASCAFMVSISRIDPPHFDRALELFPNDPDMLFFAGSVHEVFAGVRTQSAIRSMDAPRGVTFDVQTEAAELRRAEQLYKRALERNPALVEARIRLGRVLGVRGRHEEAVKELRLGLAATEPLLRYYAHLFLGVEFEALSNGAEARRSYEQAVALQPNAQSALLGLSRAADQAGDRVAARSTIERMLKLPPDDAERADPWWVYERVQARHVDRLLADLRQRFVEKRL
jgi:hypothetical protein